MCLVALSVQGDDVNVPLHFWAELPPTSMTRHPLPAARLSATCPTPTISTGRCQLSVLSAAVAMALGTGQRRRRCAGAGPAQCAVGARRAAARRDRGHRNHRGRGRRPEGQHRLARRLQRRRRALQRGAVGRAGQPAAPRRWPLCRPTDQQPPAERALHRSAARSQLELGPHRARLHGAARPADQPPTAAAPIAPTAPQISAAPAQRAAPRRAAAAPRARRATAPRRAPAPAVAARPGRKQPRSAPAAASSR